MNTILIDPNALNPDNTITVGYEQARHITKVLRAGIGDTIRAGFIGGLMGTARITALSSESCTLRPECTLPPPSPIPLTLILALPRPKTLKKVLQYAASLGVKRIHIIRTWRVEKSYWQSEHLDPCAMTRECLLGLEQACDTIVPIISIHPLFRPFVEDELDVIAGDSRRLLPHPYSNTPLPERSNTPTTLIVGPEGGLIPFEIELLESQGFVPVTLGPRILRVEVAVPTIIGRLF